MKLTSKWGWILLFALAGGQCFAVFNGARRIIKQNSFFQMGLNRTRLLALRRR